MMHQEAIERITEALSKLGKVKRFHHMSTYGMKQPITRLLGYVTDDEFQEAARRAGFTVRAIPGTRTAQLNVSKRDFEGLIKVLSEERGEGRG